MLSDQPTAVEHRIHHFVKCFIEAVLIVIIVGLFLMDWRSALVLATAIPLTVAMTLIAMQMLNIPLHQISIASLIIALGCSWTCRSSRRTASIANCTEANRDCGRPGLGRCT